MPNIRRGPLPSELGWLNDLLDDLSDRMRTLEAPSGEALNNTVATLQALVTDIQSQLNAYMASRYTNAQIDAAITAGVAAGITAVLAGNVAIGGTLYVGGKVTMPGVWALNVVSAGRPRTAVWVDNAGEVGHT